MPPTPSPIDNRGYMHLLDEALARVPVHSPEWADFNESDPGVTLVQLLAFLAENLLWRIDERQRRRRRRRLAYLAVGTAGLVALWQASKRFGSRYERCSGDVE